MFLRGQKVRIIESNARKRTHPAAGDMGYMGNLYLFPKDNFILTNIFMSSYSDGDDRCERKNFVLDLGMHKAIRNRISRKGVNKIFFAKRPHVLLNPTFFLTRKHRYGQRSYEMVQTFPQIIGTYGIWPGYVSVGNSRDRYNDSLFRIPCGRIAYAKELKSRLTLGIKDMQAWMLSILPEIIAPVQLFNDFYPADGGKMFSHARSLWEEISFLFNAEQQYDNVQYLHLKKNKLAGISNMDRSFLTGPILKMRSLSFMSVERLTRHLINNRTSKGMRLQNLKKEFGKGNVAELLNPNYVYDNGMHVPDAGFIAECLLRILMVGNNSAEMLHRLSKYLPTDKWNFAEIAESAEEIKRDADSDSAALNRIFDLIRPKSIFDWMNNTVLTTNIGGKEWQIHANAAGKKLEVRHNDPAGRGELCVELNMNEAEQLVAQAGEVLENVDDEDDYDGWDEEPEEVDDDF